MNSSSLLVLPETWRGALSDECRQDYFIELQQFVETERQLHTVFPPVEKTMAAFRYTPLDQVRVVLLGQDPYHGAGQANGLCFSVNKGIKTPPSLANIFKELQADTKSDLPTHGDLEHWARQGVLLLNTVLTVRQSEANSHRKKGWEKFTDRVISTVSQQRDSVVFILWGKPAQKKIELIDSVKHSVLVSAHPSPLSAYRGFLGSKPFSKTNQLLVEKGFDPIEWSFGTHHAPRDVCHDKPR